jgi:hypothetical protein
MKNEENFDYPFGQCLGSLNGRLTNLHGFVTWHLYNDRIMNWEELAKEFSGKK